MSPVGAAMGSDDPKDGVSFPVTVWYAPDTGRIHMRIRTSPELTTEISAEARDPNGHAELYMAFLNLLMDRDARDSS